MTKKSLLIFPLLLFCLCLASTGANAATINAASCSQADVQAAINAASAGDTVVVPSGDCTWNSQVGITNKGITLQGQTTCSGTPVSVCNDNTNITDNTGSDGALKINGASATNFVHVTGITFKYTQSLTRSNGVVSFNGSDFQVAFRFDHSHIIVASAATRGVEAYDCYGLIDHLLADVTATNGSVQMVAPNGPDIGYAGWQQPLSFGTENAVYLEDSTLNYGTQGDSAIDSYTGARWVARHNVFNGNGNIGDHGTDSGPFRSAVSFEVYNNTFTLNSPQGRIRAGTIRGGTSLWFNNTFNGNVIWDPVTEAVYRACPPNSNGWGNCDGTRWGVTALKGNTLSTGGPYFFCSNNRETQCQTNSDCSGGGSCTTFFDGAGTGGYACRDQPGIGPGQVSNPVYLWNNSCSLNGGGCINGKMTTSSYSLGNSCGVGIDNYLSENRDFFNYTTSFNGTAGVGQGLLASRPSTCSTGVAYFATDAGAQGTLYQCSSTDTWASYYEPYTYPHPLQNGDPLPPAPPGNLNAQVQ